MPYTGYRDYFDRELIVSVATTGGHHGREANPNLPIEPEEVARDVRACEAAGASIVHLHARDDDGDSKDLARFQALRDRIDDYCDDVLVNFTTGGGGVFPSDERLAPVLETTPRPDLATIDLGPMNFGRTRTAVNTRAQNERFAAAMRDAGVKPELEVFNPGHVPELEHLLDEGLVDEPYWCTLIFGMQNGTPPHPRNLQNLVDNLPDGVEWQTLAVGRHQLPLTTASIVLGGHVRVGLEDNVYRRSRPSASGLDPEGEGRTLR